MLGRCPNRAAWTRVGRLVALVWVLGLGSSVATAQEPSAPAEDPGDIFLGTPQEADRRIKDLERQALRNLNQSRGRLAVNNLKELVTLDPYESDYHISLGVLFAESSNFDEARRKFQDFIDLGGNLAVAHLLIAETHIAEGRRDKALEHLRKAAENGLNLMRAARESKRLETFRSDTEFVKLGLQLEKYQLDLDDKRDPMTTRFRRPTGEDSESGEDLGANRWSKEKQQEVLTAANRCLIRIEIFLSREDEERAMEAFKELNEYIAHEEKITIPAFAGEFRKIVDQKEQIESRIKEIRLKYYYGEAQGIVDEMRRVFRNEDYAQIDILYKDIKKIADSMLAVDPEAREVADIVLRVGQEWRTRAEIRQEFSGKGLAIQGIVYHEGSPIAILNDRVLRVGQKYDSMYVVGIERNQIMFNYKGEEIPLVFRRY